MSEEQKAYHCVSVFHQEEFEQLEKANAILEAEAIELKRRNADLSAKVDALSKSLVDLQAKYIAMLESELSSLSYIK